MDWVASILGLFSCYLVANKVHWGWLLWVVSSFIYAWCAYKAGAHGLAAGSLVYAALEIRGWILARKG